MSDLTGEERRDALLSLVLGEIAAALGHNAIDCVEPDQPLEELGCRVAGLDGDPRAYLPRRRRVRMPVTLTFDHRSTRAIAEYVEFRMFSSTAPEERARLDANPLALEAH